MKTYRHCSRRLSPGVVLPTVLVGALLGLTLWADSWIGVVHKPGGVRIERSIGLSPFAPWQFSEGIGCGPWVTTRQWRYGPIELSETYIDDERQYEAFQREAQATPPLTEQQLEAEQDRQMRDMKRLLVSSAEHGRL